MMRPTMILRQSAPAPFSVAHRTYVMSLYRRYLRNSLDWCIRRDVWRDRAIEIRAEFERNRNISNPRELVRVLQQAEEALQANLHPDPYRPPDAEHGTKWERNIPPKMFTEADKHEALEARKPKFDEEVAQQVQQPTQQ